MVSVVIPARNEGRTLRRCLEALLAQDYPAEQLEILVADGRSTDDSRAIVQDLAASHPHLTLLDNPNRTVPYALNIAIRAARGSVIVRVDGHAVVAPNYVSQCVRALDASGAANVGGPMRSRGVGFWGRTIAAAMRSPFAGTAKFHYASEPQEVDTVYLGAFRREVLERVGLFDESLPRDQDYELNHRIREAWERIYYDPAISVEYFGRESLSALLRQYWNYGAGKAVTLGLRPGALKPRHLASPLLVLGLGGGAGLALLRRPLPLLGLLALYGGASAWFSSRAAREEPGQRRAALALVFLCMHLSYGVGMLAEMLNGSGLRMLRGGKPTEPRGDAARESVR